MKPINIIGLGYIGLPTALMFASHGIKIIGTDVNKKIIKTLNENKLTFEEEGMEEIFNRSLKNGIKFQEEYSKTDKYIITVPTPYIKSSKQIDATFVIAATKQALKVCEDEAIIVIESTISPGTINKFVRPLVNESIKKIHIIHAPERIIPGKMVYELENNSRTIGTDDLEVGEEVKSWYESFCKGEIVITDIKTAEMSKVVENTFRDINIAFANELAKICRREEMDVYELIKISNKHPRVNILSPGPGVGGHCISVDPWFLVGDYPDLVNVVLGAREVNDSMPEYIFDRIHEIMRENNVKEYSRVGLYGMTYKENIDDVRESPTLQLLNIFSKYNIDEIKIYDSWIKEKYYKNQVLSMEEFLNEIEIVVVLVGHDELRNNQKILKDKIIYDTRNIINIGKKIYKI